VGFSASINPYRGCEHGCIYCYARPATPTWACRRASISRPSCSSSRGGAAAGERASKPRYRPELIHIGGNTDPYQPQERTLRITRGIIEVLVRFRHPFSVITKSALVVRDLDLLSEARGRGPGAGGDLDHQPGPQAGAARWSRAPRRRRSASTRAQADRRRGAGDGDVRALRSPA
jgi:hypothetical protein